MNKTLSVNIGGYIFNIEEDAYTQLRNYLDSISSYFAGQEGSDEIISDIEARIAELFNERLGSDRQVVIHDDVEQVIIIMGKPEQYAEAEEDTQTSSKSKSNDNRRFYRDLDNSTLGGVCSGFSHHLGWDPLIFKSPFCAFIVYLNWDSSLHHLVDSYSCSRNHGRKAQNERPKNQCREHFQKNQ